jgi:hypothetical protein
MHSKAKDPDRKQDLNTPDDKAPDLRQGHADVLVDGKFRPKALPFSPSLRGARHLDSAPTCPGLQEVPSGSVPTH